MEKKDLDLRALAERIYALDEKVYEILGSSLGRVYNGDRDYDLNYIVELLESQKGSYVLRDELALIGNMAKTIENSALQAQMMEEYHSIVQMTKKQAEHYTRIEILDEKRAQLNAMPLKKRFSDQDKKIICIGRTYGSGGTEIGFALAEELKLNYYDSAMFAEIMKRMEAGNTTVWQSRNLYQRGEANAPVYRGDPFTEPSKTSLRELFDDFSRNHGLPKRDALFFSQSKMICDIAQTENFLIVGRYADIVLTNEGIPHVNIFITAPFEKRVTRMKEMHPEMSEKEIRSVMKRSDRRHVRDYRYFTGKHWESAENYDLTVNSASYGIAGSVDLILEMLDGDVIS